MDFLPLELFLLLTLELVLLRLSDFFLKLDCLAGNGGGRFSSETFWSDLTLFVLFVLIGSDGFLELLISEILDVDLSREIRF